MKKTIVKTWRAASLSVCLIAFFFLSTINTSLAQKGDILLEGFEGGSFPAFWSYQDVSGGGSWKYQNGGANGGAYPDAAHTGSYNACYRGFPNPSISKLVTPPLDLSNGGTLNFWYSSSTYYGASDIDLLTVYYKEGSSGSWIELVSYPDGADNWTEATFNIPSTSNEVYIAFEGSYDGGLGVSIDDVHVFNSNSDLGVIAVSPVIAFGTEINPTVSISNFGLDIANNYSVQLLISDGYDTTLTITDTIASTDTTIIEFPTWTLPAEGSYTITAICVITGDAVSSNDTFTTTCAVDQTPIGNLLGYFDAAFSVNQDYHCAFPQTDGKHIYVGEWSRSKYAKFTMQGAPVGDFFQVGDFWSEDLAYDGEYFYTGNWDGVSSTSTIYKLDLANQSLVDSFPTKSAVNSLSYNTNTNTFWTNAFNSPLDELNRDGSLTGNSITLPANFDVSSSAIDRYTDPNNPTIWLYEVLAANVVSKLVEFDLATKLETGRTIPISAAAFPGLVGDEDLGGGLACYVNDLNQVVLLVGVQNITDTYEGRILFVYLGEAGTSYPTTLTVVDDYNAPIAGATVQVGSTKGVMETDANGQVIFDLFDNTYEYLVSANCYQNATGNFSVSGASPTINNISLSTVAAPQFTSGVVNSDGATIELSFNQEMNLDAQSAPAGFSVTIADSVDNIVSAVALKSGNKNTIVLTLTNKVLIGENVKFNYTAGTTQSDCNVLLGAISNTTLTNSSTILSISNPENHTFSIHPNPSNGKFTITMSNVGCQMWDVKYQITDITGRVVRVYDAGAKNLSPIHSSQISINMKDQPKGMYFIQIVSNGERFFAPTKIIIY